MKSVVARVLVAAGLLVVSGCGSGSPSNSSQNQGAEKIEFTAIGSATDSQASCNNITCNSGDSCSCMTGSAQSLLATREPASASGGATAMVNFELSIDQTATLSDGNDGECVTASGNGVVTLEYDGYADFPQYPIDFLAVGLDCNGRFSGTMRLIGDVEGIGSVRIKPDIQAPGMVQVAMDFGMLPPEINSARIYASLGSGPMLAAAGAWDFLGIGQAADTEAPCANVACSGGHNCDCITGAAVSVLLGNGDGTFQPQSYELGYELSIDQTSVLDDGNSGGECMPAAGNGAITLADGTTIDVTISGMDCTVPELAQDDSTPEATLLQTGLFEGAVHISNLLGQNTPAIAAIEIGYLGDGHEEIAIQPLKAYELAYGISVDKTIVLDDGSNMGECMAATGFAGTSDEDFDSIDHLFVRNLCATRPNVCAVASRHLAGRSRSA